MVESEEPSSNKGRVLVVEDDLDLRDMVALMLEERGYRVDTAANGREALDCFEDSRPDLILLDMRMPVMNGWEFVDAMRRRYSGLNGGLPPVVVMTAAEDARQRAAEVSAVGYVSKPFDIDELLFTIANCLTRGQTPS